jgi:5-methylcytosine-specific restriction endonuclease McrA
MKWQNLMEKRCPACDSELEEIKDRAILFECKNHQCGFFLTKRKYFEILMDESHVLRRFLSTASAEKLENAIAELNNNV